MSEKKMTAEEFVRNVLKTFKQAVDKDTVQGVAKKVRDAVDTKQKPPRTREAA
jgi:hypothetical protein